jgi:hypothetical protein
MYFAKLNESNIVETIIVADSKEWCEQNLGGMWVRAHEPLDAGINYTYNESKDVFIPPKPYESWILDEENNIWNSPVPCPQDDKLYTWNEDTISWVEIESP